MKGSNGYKVMSITSDVVVIVMFLKKILKMVQFTTFSNVPTVRKYYGLFLITSIYKLFDNIFQHWFWKCLTKHIDHIDTSCGTNR